MLAIELKLTLVVATIDDSKDRQRNKNENQREPQSAFVGREPRPHLQVSGRILQRRTCLATEMTR